MERFDAVVVDMPDPDAPATAKLYSQEFYGLAARVLAPGGRLVVQAGSPYFAPEAFWCIDETVAATGLRTATYHVDVPSFGDWGFVLAARGAAPVPSVDPAVAGRLRFLDGDVLAARQNPTGPRLIEHSVQGGPEAEQLGLDALAWLVEELRSAVTAEEAARVGAHVESTRGVHVDGDERLLRRAIRNLLENAQRYGGGDVEIGLGHVNVRGRDFVAHEVCDRGPGVPEAMRERIRERASHLRAAAAQHDTAADSLAAHLAEVDRLKEAIDVRAHKAATLAEDARTRASEGTPTDDADAVLVAFDPPPAGHRDWLTVDLPGL